MTKQYEYYYQIDYIDICINHYDLEVNEYHDCDFDGLLETCDDFKKVKYYLEEGEIDFIALRADID